MGITNTEFYFVILMAVILIYFILERQNQKSRENILKMQMEMEKKDNTSEEKELSLEIYSAKDNSKIKEFLENAFRKNMEKKSNEDLGDRSKYIGASDIAGCLRSSFLDKTTKNIKRDIKTLIKFKRGHLAEELVNDFLSDMPNLTRQMEIKGNIQDFPTKPHLDFVSETENEFIVFEVKSIDGELNEPYDSWIKQLQYQMYFLQKSVKKKVRGYIFAIDVNTGWYDLFESAPNKTLQNMTVKRAIKLIEALKNKQEPDAEEQLYCSTCIHKSTCPIMQENAVRIKNQDVNDLVKEIQLLTLNKKQLELNLNKKSNVLVNIMDKNKIVNIQTDIGNIRIVKTSDANFIDLKRIKDESPIFYEELMQRYPRKTVKQPYIKFY